MNADEARWLRLSFQSRQMFLVRSCFQREGRSALFRAHYGFFLQWRRRRTIALNVARRCHKLLIIDIDPARTPPTL